MHDALTSVSGPSHPSLTVKMGNNGVLHISIIYKPTHFCLLHPDHGPELDHKKPLITLSGVGLKLFSWLENDFLLKLCFIRLHWNNTGEQGTTASIESHRESKKEMQ